MQTSSYMMMYLPGTRTRVVATCASLLVVLVPLLGLVRVGRMTVISLVLQYIICGLLYCTPSKRAARFISIIRSAVNAPIKQASIGSLPPRTRKHRRFILPRFTTDKHKVSKSRRCTPCRCTRKRRDRSTWASECYRGVSVPHKLLSPHSTRRLLRSALIGSVSADSLC